MTETNCETFCRFSKANTRKNLQYGLKLLVLCQLSIFDNIGSPFHVIYSDTEVQISHHCPKAIKLEEVILQ